MGIDNSTNSTTRLSLTSLLFNQASLVRPGYWDCRTAEGLTRQGHNTRTSSSFELLSRHDTEFPHEQYSRYLQFLPARHSYFRVVDFWTGGARLWVWAWAWKGKDRQDEGYATY